MNKTRGTIVVLAVAVMALVISMVVQHGVTSRRDRDVENLTKELKETKATLDAERRRGARLDRRLKDVFRTARASSRNGQASEAVADALVDNYHAIAERSRSSASSADRDFAQFIATHGLASDVPEQDKQVLLAGVQSQEDPNRKIAAASFQDVDTALRTLLDAVERDPDNLSAWAALARRALSAPESSETFDKAVTELVALDPNNAYPHHLQAICSWKNGDLAAAYEAITAASTCDRYDDYQIEQIAYRDALLRDSGYPDGLSRHLAIHGVWSNQSRLSDRRGLATSLDQFAAELHAQGKTDLAVPVYQAVSQYASQLVGDSWTIIDELSALAIKQKALQGLFESQNSLDQNEQAAVTKRSLSEVEDRMARIRAVTSRMSTSAEAFTRAIAESDADLAAYYDNVLKYGEARAVEMALSNVQPEGGP